MSLLEYTRQRCPDLAASLETTCQVDLSFFGADPNLHSSHNHVHLWALEWWADHHDWIDLEYRMEFVSEIFRCWRMRLKGFAPYRDRGYRLYLYEDLAPTVSVVAETDMGFPYPGEPTFVSSRREILALYVDKSWRDQFECILFPLSADQLLAVIEKNHRSIGAPSANSLGLKVGALRTLIEQMGLDVEVNTIRKRFKRRPAAFREETHLHRYQIHEQRIEPGYA